MACAHVSALSVYCLRFHVCIVSELDQLIAGRHWVELSCVNDVCCRTDAGTLDGVTDILSADDV